MDKKIIGIMGAMPEEISGIVHLLSNKDEKEIGGRKYYSGLINNVKTIVVFSRWGKVAAAATVTTLILEFGITELIFTGVAGAVNPNLKIGDIVIGHKLFQHDMDGRPLMKQYEIPLLGVTYFECKETQRLNAEKIIRHLLSNKYLKDVIHPNELQRFGIHEPKLHIGVIASGDKFFANKKDKESLLNILPSVLCVEMEGAAVAQVCYEYQIPYTIIRTISDSADENAKFDFSSFIKSIASVYSTEIMKLYFASI
ncbi:MAG: 5'-methylthioadenosine/adenosylhomocysteine nucleosidase [Bacteroidetes bacterium]|nr:5'-methylthioadenosine/adenosylhomocysteine nucleosidase [Bacteroidota bacterium]